MSSVNEQLVREFFELLGYLVAQPAKHTGKMLSPEDEIDFIVYNPHVPEHILPPEIFWETRDLKNVRQAVVKIIGTHTTRFYPANLEHIQELTRFAKQSTIRWAASRLNVEKIATILCVSQLPASSALRKKTLDMLKPCGIDGVISFRTILISLINTIDLNKNYEKSDVLQVIRLIKNYDLIKPLDMQLFSRKHKIKKEEISKDLTQQQQPIEGATNEPDRGV
jgi:hypothetical protein